MREEQRVTLMDGEQELTFVIKKFPATKQERWINRVVMLLVKSAAKSSSIDTLTGMQASDVRQLENLIAKEGIQGFAKLLGGLEYDDIEPLYAELMTCVSHLSGDFRHACTNDKLDSLITDVTTLYKLRMEVLRMNFSFFRQGGNSPKETPPEITIPTPMRM